MRVTVWFALAAALYAYVGAARVIQRESKRIFYIGIAAPRSANDLVEQFNSTVVDELLSGYQERLGRNVTLQPMYIELPGNEDFHVSVLETTCFGLSGKRVTALLVLGSNPTAAAVTLAASYAGVPVLRIGSGSTNFRRSIGSDVLPLEVTTEITARQTLEAVRAMLIHTHWYTFTILAEEDVSSTLALRKDLLSVIQKAPLVPTILSLPPIDSKHALFRRMADLSRSSRGVIILICDVYYTNVIMKEAKRLNMLDGHFVWLWLDATQKLDVFNVSNTTGTQNDKSESVDNLNKKSKRASQEEESMKNNMRFINETYNLLMTEDIDDFNDNVNINNSYKYQDYNTSSDEHNYNNIGESVESSKQVEDIRENEKFAEKLIDVNMNNFNRYNRESRYSHSGLHDDEIRVDSIDLLMYPTVQDFTTFSVRDVPRKRTMNKFSFKKYSPTGGPSETNDVKAIIDSLPVGLLALRPLPMPKDAHMIKSAVRMMIDALSQVFNACEDWAAQAQFFHNAGASCWVEPIDAVADFSIEYARVLRANTVAKLGGYDGDRADKNLEAKFEILNLVQSSKNPKVGNKIWRPVGHVLGKKITLNTIVWVGGDIVVSGLSSRARSVFRVVTAPAPPFVMEGELDEDGQCLRGVPCYRIHTADKDNLTLAFNELETVERLEEEAEDKEKIHEDSFFPAIDLEGELQARTFNINLKKYKTNCCYGLAMDLLENIAAELEFDFHLYIVNDGLYGTRRTIRKYKRIYRTKTKIKPTKGKTDYKSEYRNSFLNDNEDTEEQTVQDDDKWNGIVGDLKSGAAHMSFSALSVTTARAEVIDFSQPYFFSGVSLLAAPKQKSDVPLLAFLLPFSPELWIAVFTSLNVTAIAVAIYEWLSPFGLNPWGRQRSKNFSISSALWVMWGLLCGHLVAFKAPKSWPNKFLINVWGGFSVIFVASYTANIAALIAGLFFQSAVDDYNDKSLLTQKVGTPRASASEYYVQRANPQLWHHIKQYSLYDVKDGIEKLRNGSLDLLIADTPILDYYRATDHGCKLQRIGESFIDDTYAIGMSKAFPLKSSINTLISKYISNGYMDILQEKWYGGLPCFKLGKDYVQPRPLGVASVAGVFILLGLGMLIGCLILIMEHLFYKYTLPILRHQPKGSVWRSRNIMFFSQKLYRFINCVELVSPHHAARELVHTLRQGQITSLFQKSVKRKEHEQRRRRKSKAQFYEMIQEIRRAQKEERDQSSGVSKSPKLDTSPRSSQQISPQKSRSRSPSTKLFNLNVRRFSTDGLDASPFQKNSLNVGRRLSKDTSSPPDMRSRKHGSSSREMSPDIRGSALSWQDVIEEPHLERRLKRCRSRGDGNSAEDATELDCLSGIKIKVEDVTLLPPPPYPRVPPKGGRNALSKLSEEELIDLWRSSESELRNHLLAALNEKKSLEPG